MIAYVVGNSWQLGLLTDQERRTLHAAPLVICCNAFPIHWREAGFVPTVWVFGDTRTQDGCEFLRAGLRAIREDPELRRRLRHVVVTVESDEARCVLAHEDLPIGCQFTECSRGDWQTRNQRLATHWTEPLYRYGSSLSSCVNVATLLEPGAEIRLLGCSYGERLGHFYDRRPDEEDPYLRVAIERFWEGMGDLKGSANLVDCNLAHRNLPAASVLPRLEQWAA